MLTNGSVQAVPKLSKLKTELQWSTYNMYTLPTQQHTQYTKYNISVPQNKTSHWNIQQLQEL